MPALWIDQQSQRIIFTSFKPILVHPTNKFKNKIIFLKKKEIKTKRIKKKI